MYINRALLLALAMLLAFMPALEEWAFHSPTVWYRPHQLWLLLIIATFLNSRSRYPDDF